VQTEPLPSKIGITDDKSTIEENRQSVTTVKDGAANSQVIENNKISPPRTFGFVKQPIQKWMLALFLLFATSVLGTAVSVIIGSSIPFWLCFGFSLIFSGERWFNYYTRKFKAIGQSYRLLLNLTILLVFGILIWSGIALFSQRFLRSPLEGSLIFLAEVAFVIWLWRVVAKNSWRSPSMKLTIFTLIIISIVLAFAGVQPLANTKDSVLSCINSTFTNSFQPSTSAVPPVTKSLDTQPVTSPQKTSAISPTRVTTSPTNPAAITITAGARLNSDKSTFQAIDQYVLGTPESVTKSIAGLAAYLIQPAKNDFEKTRAIYRWITQNISYDFSAYLTKDYGSTRAVDVLTSRSSVCEGYSGLFQALAKSAGLEVVTISGWAKGYSYNAGDHVTGPTNHAWNAVKIDGGWYLIDSTWGAGSIIQQRFVREFDEEYFLTSPEYFIYNHLPEDSKWQLLNTPLSKNEFSSLPYVHSKFFSYGLNLGSNTQSVINTKGSLSMNFPVPNDTYLMARLSLGSVELAETFTSARRSGNQYQINATFPNPGTYILSIFARKNGEYGMYDGVLEYKVIVGSSP
jgi:hypothetical protein